jgi:hypothetical protein
MWRACRWTGSRCTGRAIVGVCSRRRIRFNGNVIGSTLDPRQPRRRPRITLGRGRISRCDPNAHSRSETPRRCDSRAARHDPTTRRFRIRTPLPLRKPLPTPRRPFRLRPPLHRTPRTALPHRKRTRYDRKALRCRLPLDRQAVPGIRIRAGRRLSIWCSGRSLPAIWPITSSIGLSSYRERGSSRRSPTPRVSSSPVTSSRSRTS